MSEERNATEIPVACVPDAIPAEARADHFERIERLFGSVRERVDLAEGYAFRLDAERLADVAGFVEHERRCCPFLTIRIEQLPDAGALWLRLTGPAGTRECLEAELLRSAKG